MYMYKEDYYNNSAIHKTEAKILLDFLKLEKLIPSSFESFIFFLQHFFLMYIALQKMFHNKTNTQKYFI